MAHLHKRTNMAPPKMMHKLTNALLLLKHLRKDNPIISFTYPNRHRVCYTQTSQTITIIAGTAFRHFTSFFLSRLFFLFTIYFICELPINICLILFTYIITAYPIPRYYRKHAFVFLFG